MSEAQDKQRLDQWLFRARFFKSRTIAAEMCKGGKIRVDGQIIRKANYLISPGHVLTFPKADIIRVIKVDGLPTRRGPAPEAATFYEDLTPEQMRLKTNYVPGPGKREKGAGRPTKKERRAITRLKNND